MQGTTTLSIREDISRPDISEQASCCVDFITINTSRVFISQPVHGTATYRCDDIRDCIVQFWPPDDEHMCSKHVEA